MRANLHQKCAVSPAAYGMIKLSGNRCLVTCPRRNTVLMHAQSGAWWPTPFVPEPMGVLPDPVARPAQLTRQLTPGEEQKLRMCHALLRSSKVNETQEAVVADVIICNPPPHLLIRTGQRRHGRGGFKRHEPAIAVVLYSRHV